MYEWIFACMHMHAGQATRGRGVDQNLLGGGYRPILNQVNFPGSASQLSQPAQFQPSPAQTSVTVRWGRCRDVAVTDCVCVCVWCICVFVCVVVVCICLSVCTCMYVLGGN